MSDKNDIIKKISDLQKDLANSLDTASSEELVEYLMKVNKLQAMLETFTNDNIKKNKESLK